MVVATRHSERSASPLVAGVISAEGSGGLNSGKSLTRRGDDFMGTSIPQRAAAKNSFPLSSVRLMRRGRGRPLLVRFSKVERRDKIFRPSRCATAKLFQDAWRRRVAARTSVGDPP